MSENDNNDNNDINRRIDDLQSQFNRLILQIEKNMKHYVQIDRKFTVISVDMMDIKDDLEVMKTVINGIKNELETTDKFKDTFKNELDRKSTRLNSSHSQIS